jgi:hypothetical protein
MKSPLLVLVAALCSSAALAQDADRHFYFGVDAGQGRIHRANPGYTDSPGGNAKSFAGRLLFGWRLSPHWSFEAGYADLGDYHGTLMSVLPTTLPHADPGGGASAPGDFSTSVKGFAVSAVSTWPLGRSFYVSATVGLMRREMQTRNGPSAPYLPAGRLKDGDLAASYGAGFGWRLTDVYDIGVNWLSTRNLEGGFEFPENESDPAMLSVGMRFRL